jgi:hypothetical protein
MPKPQSQQVNGRNGRRRARQTGKNEVSRFAGDAYSLAERAIKGVNHVLKLINIETKFYDLPYGVTFGNTPISVHLSAIPQGVDMSQRVGNSVKLQDMHLRYDVAIPSAALVQTIRIILFRDMEPSGALPLWADFIAFNNQSSPQNYYSTSRFKVFYDVSTVIQPLSFQGYIVDQHFPSNGHIKWKTNAANPAAADEGHIYAFFYTTSIGVYPLSVFNLRLAYTDD